MKAAAWHIATWAARIVVAGLFIYASAHKILDPATFAKDIYNYQMVPSSVINAMAILLPWLELLCGLALLFMPALRKGSAVILGLLLVIFTVAIASALARGLDISCGCFKSGGGGDAMSWLNILRNLVLIGLCAVAWPRASAAGPVTEGSSPAAAG